MSMKLRNEIKTKYNRVVVKLGSLCITNPDGGIRHNKLKEIVSDIVEIRKMGIQVILVSSGAVNAGKPYIVNKHKNSNISHFQACSAVGQPLLMHEFHKEFSKFNIFTAQVLLTHDDIKNRTRYYNLKSTLEQILEDNIIPILNENDSVSFEEITLGDNDQLAAMTCEMLSADCLCLLTEIDGLFTKNPDEKDAERIPIVDFDDQFEQINIFKKTMVGRGGMDTKLKAVRKLTPLGISVIITSFKPTSPVLRAFTQDAGSYFAPDSSAIKSKKKARILTQVRNEAVVRVDEGAYNALLKDSSLLPVGIKDLFGNFKRGDVVCLKFKNKIFAYGISEYDSKDVKKIIGIKSHELNAILDFVPSTVVIHRNNFILKK